MTNLEKEKLLSFLTQDRKQYSELILLFLSQLDKEVKFKLKIQKATIQLYHNVAFAVIGFRRSQSHVFIEFYNSDAICNPRIVKSITKPEHPKLVINRINVSSLHEIDIELLTWVKTSSLLT